MKRHWKTFTLLAVVALAAFGAVAVASAATSPSPASTPDAGTTRSGDCDCLGAIDDPAALAELEALRAEKREAWQAWFDKWGTDRRSEEAQAELEQLREWYRSEMTALLEKYGIDPSACTGHDERFGADGGRMNGNGDCDGTGDGFGGGTGGGFGGGHGRHRPGRRHDGRRRAAPLTTVTHGAPTASHLVETAGAGHQPGPRRLVLCCAVRGRAQRLAAPARVSPGRGRGRAARRDDHPGRPRWAWARRRTAAAPSRGRA